MKLRRLFDRNITALALDLDGVVYHGAAMLPGAAAAIRAFADTGRKVVYLTNNSSKSARSVREKLCNLGVACEERQILTAAEAAGSYFRLHRPDHGRGCHVVGSAELLQLLQRDYGVVLAPPGECGALLIGYDIQFGHQTLVDALTAALRGVPMHACNRDANFPGEGGVPQPGCGALVGAIESASRRRALNNIGKPAPFMLELMLSRIGVAPRNCLMVGDSLESDVAMARAAGCSSVWITSGQTRTGRYVPDFRAVSLADLAAQLGLPAALTSAPSRHALRRPRRSRA